MICSFPDDSSYPQREDCEDFLLAVGVWGGGGGFYRRQVFIQQRNPTVLGTWKTGKQQDSKASEPVAEVRSLYVREGVASLSVGRKGFSGGGTG